MKKLLLILIVCFGLNAFGQTTALNSGLSKLDIIGLNTFTVPDSLTTNKPTKEATMCRKGKTRVVSGLIVIAAAVGMYAIGFKEADNGVGLPNTGPLLLGIAGVPIGIFGIAKTINGISMQSKYCE